MADEPSSVTATGRVLSAPGGVLGSSHPPRTAGAIRAGWGATIGLVLTGVFYTIQKWAGLPSEVWIIWTPIIGAVIRQVEAEIDQRLVVS